MGQLKKATLQEIKSDDSRAPVEAAVPVQFNPASLKLKLSNQIEGGRSRGRQKRQYIGSSSSVLSLELIFDTADEAVAPPPVEGQDPGSAPANTFLPRSVREKTQFVERFVLPKKAGAKETPPKLRFSWGKMLFEGIVESLDVDFDHFAPDGTPLRAKVNLSIKEQNAEYQFLKSGPGAARAPGVTEPGKARAGTPGSSGATTGEQVVTALAEETGPELAARVGVDPAAWRSLDVDLSAGLGLEAGVEVGFNTSHAGGAGVGVHVGAEAGADLSIETAFGLETSSGVSSGFGNDFGGSMDADLAAGFALSAAGGVDSAVESVKITRSAGEASAAAKAFAAEGAETQARPTATPSRPRQERKPLLSTGHRSPGQQAAASATPPLPRSDSRASSYGLGVPLRPRLAGAAEERRSRPDAPSRLDPTTPPWVALPIRDRGRLAAAETQHDRRPAKSCGCHGSCRHGKGGRR